MTDAVAFRHQPVLVIVGMHRSGTSLVASLCQGGGIDVGTHLLGPQPGNEEGHFEDLDFHHWHERVLRANGFGVEGFVTEGSLTVPEGLRREAEELVQKRRSLGRPWGWKNPRTTLLLDFWQSLIPEAVFLGVVRPPWAVVDSLFRRGDAVFRINPPLALAVWRQYNALLHAFAERHPEQTFVCDLADAASKPGDLFATLRDRFGVPLGDPPDRFKPRMLQAVAPPWIPSAICQGDAEAVRLYEALRGSATNADDRIASPRGTMPPFDGLLHLWSSMRELEASVARTEASLENATTINAGLIDEIHQTRVALDEAMSRAEGLRLERDGIRSSTAEEIATQVREIQRLSADLQDARQRAATVGEQLAIAEDELNNTRASLLAAEAKVIAAQTDRAATNDDLEAAKVALAQATTRGQELEAHLGGQTALLDELRAELAARASDGEARASDLATAEATIEVLRGDVTRLEAACLENIRARRQFDEELFRLTRNHSKRLSGRLRSLGRRAGQLPMWFLRQIGRLGRQVWPRMPSRMRLKQKLQNLLFTRAAWAFRGTGSYRRWQQRQAALSLYLDTPKPTGDGRPAVMPTREGDQVRVIAMHLPQFHRIPENDTWWGEGFTEWTNVRRSRPMFRGHVQPEIPHPDIGYYDLLDPATLERQAAMARQYGIHGFCFYYYWFDGRRLLEKPIEQMLATGRPNFPFCLCWANENWTRTWDGLDREVLMAQNHSPDSDARFIRDLLPYLRDHRYIRVEGRPLVAVYRAALLPDPADTAAIWRQICWSEGIGEIHLASVRSFDTRDPRAFGFDASIQFPPLLTPAQNHAGDPAIGADPTFCGSIFDYDDAARHVLVEATPDYPLYRGVMPAWDNTPRRLERSTAWINASPEKYGRWLRATIDLVRGEQPPERQLVFINAWNEWAEGAHLEPDMTRGYRHLEETAVALGVAPQPRLAADAPDTFKLLVISHDAHLAGAQMIALKTVQQWRRAGLENVRIVCVGGGVLRDAFAECYPTTVLEDLPDEAARRRALAACADFDGQPPSVVYSSTVVNGPVLEWISHLGMPIVTHAHELQKSIERWAPGEIMAATCRATDLYLAGAPAIRENLIERHGIAADLIHVVPEHIDCDVEPPTPEHIAELRRSWNAGPDELVVFGCGTTDWRKGPDLFCETAARALAEFPSLRFVWAGGDGDYYRAWLAERNLADKVHFLGTREDVRQLLHAADIFLLSSREDPMPLVALEAAATRLPVVCFEGAGDIPTVVGDGAGVVVPMEDVAAATEAVLALARDPASRRRLGAAGETRIRSAHDSRVAAARTLTLLRIAAAHSKAPVCEHHRPLVSVIVPNYEHAAYLPERLASIASQTVSDIEIILLDDCSTDGSLGILEEFARSEPRARIVPNAVNSGSAFRQWKKGLALARGRYVWIAESDDSARPGFLHTLVGLLDRHPEAILAYCQSEMIDEHGNSFGVPNDWTADLSPTRWRSPYVAAGQDEIATALIHKNTIPNVSGVVFRNTPELAEAIDNGMRLCGDWLAYVRLCGRGDVAYSPQPLNLWRQRTSNSRTRPPGELEWAEGQQVILEASAILGLDTEGRRERLTAFRRRCDGWLAAAGASHLTNEI